MKKLTVKEDVRAAKEVSEKYGLPCVIILAYNRAKNEAKVVTYGKTKENCKDAAAGGNALKRDFLKWPEDMCNAKPKKIKFDK